MLIDTRLRGKEGKVVGDRVGIGCPIDERTMCPTDRNLKSERKGG